MALKRLEEYCKVRSRPSSDSFVSTCRLVCGERKERGREPDESRERERGDREGAWEGGRKGRERERERFM